MAWWLPLLIGGGMTLAGAMGQRRAQRAALALRSEHELDALRRERMAAEIRDRAAREAHDERSAGRRALIEELPAFGADATAQQRKLEDLLGQAVEAGRERAAVETEAAPLPAEAGRDAYEKAQRIVRTKLDARGRQMDALRRAVETPGVAAVGTGRRLRSLADVLGGAAGNARLAADLGAAEAMPWETSGRLARGWGAQVQPSPSLLTSIFSGLGPTVTGYGMGQGLAGMMGGAEALPDGPLAPVTEIPRWARPRLTYPSGAFG